MLDPFKDVLEAARSGRMIIMVDDADRENEGDLVIPTAHVSKDVLSFMMREARGLICASISTELADRLQLPPQASSNTSSFQTPFTISVDAREVVDRGVTAEARAITFKKLIAPDASPDDFVSPGHVFPLVASPLGVFGRRGQTEGSYDLARLCGLPASGVICEILNPDGSMARGETLIAFARKHNLLITSVAEIVRHRTEQEVLVREVARTEIQTKVGPFSSYVLADDATGSEHLALVYGNIKSAAAPRVRIHSECLTGDVFGSRRCDCGAQLELAMAQIAADKAGVVLYLRQEGRGIGLGNKLRAYALQDQGHDTVEANLALGFEPDLRDFAVAAKMLRHLGVSEVRLLTNNPEKVRAIEAWGLVVKERLPLLVPSDEYSKAYLETKRQKLGHLL